MRNSVTYHYILGILFMSTMLVSLNSCDENEFPVDKSYERMFRPHTLTALDVTATGVTLEWPKVIGTALYILELSTDSLEFANIIQTFELNADDVASEASMIRLILNNLAGGSTYSARVKVTSRKGIPDSEYSEVTFKTGTEQIMFPVEDGDRTTTSVTLHWQPGVEVTHIQLTPSGGTAETITITADEKAAGSKTIESLTPGTNYAVAIYNNENRRGGVSFITYSFDVPGADIIVYLTASDVFTQTTFDTLTVSSVTFVLPQGAVYENNSALTLKNNTSIAFFGAPGANRPIMAWNGITLPGVAGTIRFESVDLTGYQYSGGVETSTKRNYIFNQSISTTTDEVIFENCIIRNFVNTPFRIQSSNAISIGKLIFNNCIAFDTGNNGSNGTYAFISNNVATGKIDNIEITNSTIYNIGYGLILHNSAPSQSVKIENCTFNDVIGDGRYFIDYNAQTAGTFTFSKCIIGKSKSPANTARGIRISGGATTSLSYKTSDFNTVANNIVGLTDYSGLSTDLFVDPAAGNFNFKDVNFEGKNTTGDPRWRP